MAGHAVQPRHPRRARRAEPRAVRLRALRRAMQAAGQQHEPPRRQLPQLDRADQQVGAEPMAADQRPAPGDVDAERREHAGQPVEV